MFWLSYETFSVLCDFLSNMVIQIIQIWKWKQNVWQKTYHTWIEISPEQKMV